ncbi:hypothetical protein [Saccharothrix xinjiangensis]|uniref:Uncharacterized protein n=1 Tax=Saccharothrix xinjiangensis TaxID=204798 RepID=A0ABV9XYU4_9PSEU
MYLVANRLDNSLTTSTTDRAHAERVCAGFEQLHVRRDIGAANHYWHLGRPRLGQPHPYDAEERARLRAELARLIATRSTTA